MINSALGLSAFEHLHAYARGDDPLHHLAGAARLWRVVETWGREPELFVDLVAPSQNGNAAFTRWIARYQRQTASPADMKRQLESVIGLDANKELPNIKAPTLVMNVKGDRLIPPQRRDATWQTRSLRRDTSSVQARTTFAGSCRTGAS